MDTSFRLFPEQASTQAGRVDALLAYLLIVSTVMIVLIAGAIVYFVVKYRRRAEVDRSPVSHSRQMAVEVIWIVAPFVLMSVMFFWGAQLYFDEAWPPADALEINVVAKQWMWKFQHPEGNREINELHVPLGRAVRLMMISQDVIHSFYVPAFRTKHDVLPGRYSSAWFQASKLGEYHLFCAEYCGTNHSLMGGRVVVVEPSSYESWLSGGRERENPTQAGRELFEQMRCANCHQGETRRGPALENLYGSTVKLQNGATVVADDNYIRESIVRPAAKVVAGYEPIMPSFAGQLGEQSILDLIAYIKSLANRPPRSAP